jgi:predicted Zn finger-like uncharacterized protein
LTQSALRTGGVLNRTFTLFARLCPAIVLATRCPNCLTVFRLAPDQLAVSGGQVRCGHCNAVFDGNRNQIDLPVEPSAGKAPASVSTADDAADARRSLLARRNAREPALNPALSPAEPPLRKLSDPLSNPQSALREGTAARSAAIPPSHTPVAASDRKPASRGRAVRSSLLGLLLIILLLGAALQYAWWQREYFRVVWPPSQVAYEAVCRISGCKLTPVHDIDLLQIADMSLREIDDPHHLALALTIRNRVGLTLAYPSVELTLTDNHNQAAIRKVIAPAQYLSDPSLQDNGIGPRAQVLVGIRVDTTTVPASNYRVKIFYP